MNAPLVAVVTPVYNGAKYLAETMACVQAQTYSNIVHVLRDNASTDATPDIIREYANGRHPLAVTRGDVTIPMAPNWNAAIDLVPREAAYFRVLCADDLMSPTAVEKMVAVAERDPKIGVVGCAIERDGAIEDPQWPKDTEIFEGHVAIERCFNGQGAILAPHMIWRRELLEERHPFFDNDIIENDTEVALWVLLKWKLGFVHEPLGFTRVHPDRFTATQYGQTHDNFASWLQIMTRIGPQAIPPSRFNPLLQRYRMYHLRKMLQWRLAEGNTAAFSAHAQIMRDLGYSVGAGDFAASMGDWMLKRLGVHPGWSGHPY